MYDIKPENNEHKLERISKFVSNLESNRRYKFREYERSIRREG